jgi:hypothetical protein
VTSGDNGVDCLLVVRSVRNERRDVTVDLIEQCADLQRIIYVVGRQCDGDDLAGIRIDADVQFAP